MLEINKLAKNNITIRYNNKTVKSWLKINLRLIQKIIW